VLKNILVEEQMLDEVAFQTRFMSSAARRSIMGYQPTYKDAYRDGFLRSYQQGYSRNGGRWRR